jgi:hypothetical protein
MKTMYQAIVRQNCGLIRSFLGIGEGPPALTDSPSGGYAISSRAATRSTALPSIVSSSSVLPSSASMLACD